MVLLKLDVIPVVETFVENFLWTNLFNEHQDKILNKGRKSQARKKIKMHIHILFIEESAMPRFFP